MFSRSGDTSNAYWCTPARHRSRTRCNPCAAYGESPSRTNAAFGPVPSRLAPASLRMAVAVLPVRAERSMAIAFVNEFLEPVRMRFVRRQ